MTARAACCRSAARAPPRFCGEWYHPCDTTFAGCGGGGITRMIPPCPRQDSNRNPPWLTNVLAGIPIGIHPATPRLFARLPPGGGRTRTPANAALFARLWGLCGRPNPTHAKGMLL